MNKFPTLVTTYQRTFSLYAQTYIEVLPFVLLYVICQYFLDKILPIPIHGASTQFLIKICIQIMLSSIFFCFVMYGIYHKYHENKFNYSEIFIKGSRRFVPVLLSGVILSLPMIIIGGSFFLISTIFRTGPATTTTTVTILALYYIAVIIFALLYLAIVVVNCYVAGVLIVNRGTNAWEGLKQSWRLVRPFWYKIFVRVMIMSVIISLLMWILHTLVGSLSKEIMSLLTFTLGPSLMVILYEGLEKAHQQ